MSMTNPGDEKKRLLKTLPKLSSYKVSPPESKHVRLIRLYFLVSLSSLCHFPHCRGCSLLEPWRCVCRDQGKGWCCQKICGDLSSSSGKTLINLATSHSLSPRWPIALVAIRRASPGTSFWSPAFLWYSPEGVNKGVSWTYPSKIIDKENMAHTYRMESRSYKLLYYHLYIYTQVSHTHYIYIDTYICLFNIYVYIYIWYNNN